MKNTFEMHYNHFNVFGQTRLGNSSPTFHTRSDSNAQLYDADMAAVSQKLDRKCTVPSDRVLIPGLVACESFTLSAHPQLLLRKVLKVNRLNSLKVCVRRSHIFLDYVMQFKIELRKMHMIITMSPCTCIAYC